MVKLRVDGWWSLSVSLYRQGKNGWVVVPLSVSFYPFRKGGLMMVSLSLYLSVSRSIVNVRVAG